MKNPPISFAIDKPSGQCGLPSGSCPIGYDKEVLASPIDLDIRRKDAVALVGPNGIGKSTLLKSLIGELPFLAGSAHLGTNVSIGYYDQGQTELNPRKQFSKNFGTSIRLPWKWKFAMS